MPTRLLVVMSLWYLHHADSQSIRQTTPLITEYLLNPFKVSDGRLNSLCHKRYLKCKDKIMYVILVLVKTGLLTMVVWWPLLWVGWQR